MTRAKQVPLNHALNRGKRKHREGVWPGGGGPAGPGLGQDQRSGPAAGGRGGGQDAGEAGVGRVGPSASLSSSPARPPRVRHLGGSFLLLRVQAGGRWRLHCAEEPTEAQRGGGTGSSREPAGRGLRSLLAGCAHPGGDSWAPCHLGPPPSFLWPREGHPFASCLCAGATGMKQGSRKLHLDRHHPLQEAFLAFLGAKKHLPLGSPRLWPGLCPSTGYGVRPSPGLCAQEGGLGDFSRSAPGCCRPPWQGRGQEKAGERHSNGSASCSRGCVEPAGPEEPGGPSEARAGAAVALRGLWTRASCPFLHPVLASLCDPSLLLE